MCQKRRWFRNFPEYLWRWKWVTSTMENSMPANIPARIFLISNKKRCKRSGIKMFKLPKARKYAISTIDKLNKSTNSRIFHKVGSQHCWNILDCQHRQKVHFCSRCLFHNQITIWSIMIPLIFFISIFPIMLAFTVVIKIL